MYRLIATGSHGTEFSNSHFGGNILATRDRIGDEGTFDEAADYLNLGALRYPGGSLTERYFDITNPDRDVAPRYGEPGEQPLLPFSDFMTFAEETGRGALIVLPTRTFLSEQSDRNGDRFDAVDETALRGFIKDTLDGVYGAPKILGFELGNEYWDSGEMTSVEYGRVASTMARIIHDEMNQHPDFDDLYQDTDILVQMGMNFGYSNLAERYTGTAEQQLQQFAEDYGVALNGNYIYSNGNVAWPQLSNLLVIREFDLPEEREAVDGIVAHTYSRGEFAHSSHTFALQTLTQTWESEFPDARPVVTEWNVRNRDRDPNEDFGLVQATEMLDLLEAMTLYGVESAFVYPVQQRNPASLTGDRGDVAEKLAGVFFNMVQETLPGTRPLVLEGAGRRESELVTDKGEIHAFAGDDRLVLYITSTVDSGIERLRFDLNQLIESHSSITMEKLGVAAGESPGSATATPVLSTLKSDNLFRNGVVRLDLGPREIVEVVLSGVRFTPETLEALDMPPYATALVAAPEPEIIPQDAIFLETAPTGTPDSYDSIRVLSDGAVMVQNSEGTTFVYSASAFSAPSVTVADEGVTESSEETGSEETGSDETGSEITDRGLMLVGGADDTLTTADIIAQWSALIENARIPDSEPDDAEDEAESGDSGGGGGGGFDLDGLLLALGLLPLLALAAAF